MHKSEKLEILKMQVDAGDYLFIVQKDKTPFPGFMWPEESTRDKAKIEAWLDQHPDCSWAVDLGKSGKSVIDFDVGEGKNGFETAEKMNLKFYSHYRIGTPSGGIHLYCKDDLPNSVSKIGPGIDTRGKHGYVLVPPSPGYEFIETGPLEPAPQFIKDLLKKVDQTKKVNRDDSMVDLDLSHNVDQAIDYLDNAPEAIEGQGGDNQTYQVACRVRDFGISESTCLELMLDIYNDKCHPPWDYNGMAKKVRSAYTYSKDRVGNASLEAKFNVPDLRQLGKTESYLRKGEQLMSTSVKNRKKILGNRYIRGVIGLTAATGGTGKTKLVTLEAISIVTGWQLTHNKVHQKCRTWLHSTEDPIDEMERTIVAVSEFYNLSAEDREGLLYSSGYDKPLKVVIRNEQKQPVINTPVVDWIVKTINEHNIEVFILDPLVGAHSMKENDNDEMNLVMEAFRYIIKNSNTDLAIQLVHHTPKGRPAQGDANAVRGAGAIVAAARIAHTLYVMQPKEAEAYGLSAEEALWYVRLDSAKANLSAPHKGTHWYKKHSVYINQMAKDADDSTGVLEKVTLDRVEEEADIDVMLDMLVGMMEDGESKTTKVLADAMDLTGVFSISARTIRRKLNDYLEGLSDDTFTVGMTVFRVIPTENKYNKRPTLAIERVGNVL